MPKIGLIMITALALCACGQPTREELLATQEAKEIYCQDKLDEIQDNDDRPLIKATLQESYNRECLSNYPAELK